MVATTVAVQALTPPPSVNGMGTLQAQAEALALTAFKKCGYKPLKLVSALHAAREVLDEGYSPVVNKDATLDTICHFHALVIPDKKAPGNEAEIRSYIQDVIRHFIEKQQSAVTGSPSPMEENEPLAGPLSLAVFPTAYLDSQGVEPWGGSLVSDAQSQIAQLGHAIASHATEWLNQDARALVLGGVESVQNEGAQLRIELSEHTVAIIQWAHDSLLGGGHGPT
ncbi:hypothetical protein EBZ35_05300 [bacterium]|nr:hypothetical protein [bacterium]